MWRPWLVGLILGLGFSGVATAETIDTSSTIVAVTVFPDRALVTRRAELKLAKGVHAVRVSSLPGTIEDESISAKGSGEAKVTNDTELVFLPGDVQVFLDGAFVGSSSIDLVGPTEHFELYLGVDERIRVERRQLNAKVDVSVLPGIHGKMKTIDYEYLTTLENRRSSPSEITIIDQLPVSQHDEIKVEQVVFDPKPREQDEEKPGVHRWTLSLPPSGKQSVKLSYRVKHPVDFVVDGL